MAQLALDLIFVALVLMVVVLIGVVFVVPIFVAKVFESQVLDKECFLDKILSKPDFSPLEQRFFLLQYEGNFWVAFPLQSMNRILPGTKKAAAEE